MIPIDHGSRQVAGRDDGGPQKCGDTTFVNAPVSGEIAPKRVVRDDANRAAELCW
jgi:hypothetical protein